MIELTAPSPEPRFARIVGSRTDRVYAGFDSVIIDGYSDRIRQIYELSREEARALKRRWPERY